MLRPQTPQEEFWEQTHNPFFKQLRQIPQFEQIGPGTFFHLRFAIWEIVRKNDPLYLNIATHKTVEKIIKFYSANRTRQNKQDIYSYFKDKIYIKEADYMSKIYLLLVEKHSNYKPYLPHDIIRYICEFL